MFKRLQHGLVDRSLGALVARTGATVWASNHEADGIEAKAPLVAAIRIEPRLPTVVLCPERAFRFRAASRRLTPTARSG